MRVLVVEDEQLLAEAVATGLRREAMAVDVVYDGEAALQRIAVNDYDGHRRLLHRTTAAPAAQPSFARPDPFAARAVARVT